MIHIQRMIVLYMYTLMLKGLLKILMCFFSKQENNQAGTHNFDKTFESNVFILFFGDLQYQVFFLLLNRTRLDGKK